MIYCLASGKPPTPILDLKALFEVDRKKVKIESEQLKAKIHEVREAAKVKYAHDQPLWIQAICKRLLHKYATEYVEPFVHDLTINGRVRQVPHKTLYVDWDEPELEHKLEFEQDGTDKIKINLGEAAWIQKEMRKHEQPGVRFHVGTLCGDTKAFRCDLIELPSGVTSEMYETRNDPVSWKEACIIS